MDAPELYGLDSRVIDDIMIDLNDRSITLERIASRNSTTVAIVRGIAHFHHIHPDTRKDY